MVFGILREQATAQPEQAIDAVQADHTCEYRVRDLPTRSVTLFPSRAQVVRDIKNISLKSGINQVIIVGLTPTLDEHSVKVEGTGTAVITDLNVSLLPNREIFEEIYRDNSDNAESDDSSSDSDDGDDDEVNSEIKSVRSDICRLLDEQMVAQEKIHSAENRVKMLDAFGNSMATDREANIDISVGIESYRSEREKAFSDHLQGKEAERKIGEKLAALRKTEARLLKQANKARAKILAAKMKEEERRRRKTLEQTREARRLRKERESFWPKKAFTVKVTLEVNHFTPSTSRRSSIVSDIAKPTVEKPSQDGVDAHVCDLSLSYVTTYAFWSPAYDLALSTTSNSGVMCFDARLTNQTSETWDNCRIVLSTSQTDWTLGESIPSLNPWRVRLAGKGQSGQNDSILYSRDEMSPNSLWKQRDIRFFQKPRWELFGVDSNPSWHRDHHLPQHQQQSQRPNLFGQTVYYTSAQPACGQTSTHAQASLFGNAAPAPAGSLTTGGGGFGAASTAPGQASRGGLFGGANTASAFGQTASANVTTNQASAPIVNEDHETGRTARFEGFPERLEDQATLAEPQPDLDFEESTFEETGLTTTYDLPGQKSLRPSSSTSKQRVVRITYSDVVYQHVIVAKHKRAAFLKTKVRNSSKLTLLKGQASVTLDGSFLGRLPIPRSSPGESFSLSLGVDPTIKVIYPKPDVKRSASGMFSLAKENSSVYLRALTLINTSPSKTAHITVLDQIPISEDERLKIELLKPSGLVCDGPRVSAGAQAQQQGSSGKPWGKAEAKLKKSGEITWEVTLMAGGHAKFDLEYQCVVPSGDKAVNADLFDQ